LDDGKDTVASPPGTDASVSSRPHNFLSKSRPVRSYNSGVVVPQGMRKLEELDTLGVIDVGDVGGEATLKIGQFHKIRKLGVSGINSVNFKLLYSFLRLHDDSLKSLLVKFEGDNTDYCDIPIGMLESFKLYGHVGKFPLKCIECLTCLRKLTLQIDMLAQTDIEVIIGLKKTYCVAPFLQ
jgi:hypothetical protein